jgi:hypothetical protein
MIEVFYVQITYYQKQLKFRCLAYVTYFEIMEVGLCNLHAVCVPVNPSYLL